MHPVNYLFEDIYGNDWASPRMPPPASAVAGLARGSAICTSLWSASAADRQGIFMPADWIDSNFFKRRPNMHPVKHLFEDIYRNYWGISPAAERPERQRLKPAKRKRELLPERQQD